MSLELFNSLDADTQKIFLDSAQEAAEYERAWVAEQEAGQAVDIQIMHALIRRDEGKKQDHIRGRKQKR